MTTPTQAAKDLVYRFEHESAALHRIQRDWLVKEIAALLAAQVGEKEMYGLKKETYDAIYDASFAAGKAATIERCAQVAENTAEPGQWGVDLGAEIASAIRKLKDKP